MCIGLIRITSSNSLGHPLDVLSKDSTLLYIITYILRSLYYIYILHSPYNL